MELISYCCPTAFFHPFRSETWVHTKPSFSMAFNQFSFLSSNEMLKMVKFFSLNVLNAFTTLGFSARHGLHQLAQKSTNTYLPLKSLNDTGLPDVSFCLKSIAVFPIPVNLSTSILCKILLAGKLFFAAGKSLFINASTSSIRNAYFNTF